MSTILEDVEAFRKFVLEHSGTEEAGIAIEDLFQRWHASRLSQSELQQSLESLNRGLADVAAGRLIDANDAIQQTRSRLLKK
jgi:predicted transcriptional regulator